MVFLYFLCLRKDLLRYRWFGKQLITTLYHRLFPVRFRGLMIWFWKNLSIFVGYIFGINIDFPTFFIIDRKWNMIIIQFREIITRFSKEKVKWLYFTLSNLKMHLNSSVINQPFLCNGKNIFSLLHYWFSPWRVENNLKVDFCLNLI